MMVLTNKEHTQNAFIVLMMMALTKNKEHTKRIRRSDNDCTCKKQTDAKAIHRFDNDGAYNIIPSKR